MRRSELIKQLADANPGLTRKEVEEAVLTIFNVMTDSLVQGRRIELRGFGIILAPMP